MSRAEAKNRKSRRPFPLVPTVIAGMVLAVLLGLGFWQLARLDWKAALIATAQERLDRPSTQLPQDLADAEALDFQRVSGQGTILGDGWLYLTGGSPSGRAGLRILAPARFDGNDTSVLVDLGWIPLDRRNETIQLPSAIAITGVLRAPQEPGWLTPDNDPAGNAWKWLDIPAMATALDVPALAPMLLRAETLTLPDGSNALPDLERDTTTIDLRNDHLQYALTWFALAFGLVVIYVVFVRRHLREGNPQQQ